MLKCECQTRTQNKPCKWCRREDSKQTVNKSCNDLGFAECIIYRRKKGCFRSTKGKRGLFQQIFRLLYLTKKLGLGYCILLMRLSLVDLFNAAELEYIFLLLQDLFIIFKAFCKPLLRRI
ncbi:hypothetical protein SUGI_0593860 [Cryptomeria japonica]|nr:hypothetical protein SUGI_0593860 [Cryptomeria japonica]